MKILSYEQFVLESNGSSRKKELLEQIMLRVAESVEETAFVKLLIEHDFFSELLYEENLADKMKRKYQDAVEIMKQKGKDALSTAQEKILKFKGNIMNVIKIVAEKVSALMKEVWNSVRSAADSAVSKVKDDIIEKVKSTKDKHALSDEIKNAKSLAKSGVTWIVNGFSKAVSSAEVKAVKMEESLTDDEIEIALLEAISKLSHEDLAELFESSSSDGIPFLSAIANKLHHFPPFSILSKASKLAEKAAKNTLDRASIILSEVAGAPGPYEFTIIPALVGIVAGYKIEHAAAEGALQLIPGIGTFISIISTLGLVIAVVQTAELAIKTKEDQ